jgi:O-antigen/teichoic acid export membrane protein
MTFLTLIQQLIMGPITNGFSRYFSIAQEKGSIRSYLKGAWSLLAKCSGLTFLVFILVFIVLMAMRERNASRLLFFSFLFTVVSSYNVALDNIQNAARQRVVVAWHQGLSQWLRFLFAAGLVLGFGSSSSYAMLGYCFAAILVIVSQWHFFQKSDFYTGSLGEKGFPSAEWEQQIFHFALPFSLWGIFTWAQMSSDRWALQTFQTTESVGLYAVLYQLGYYPIIILTGIFVQFISPVLYRRVGAAVEIERVQSTQKITNQLTLTTLIFTALITIFVWLFRDLIFLLFVAPEFRGVSFLLPWLTLSGGLFASGQISALTALNNNQPHVLLGPKIFTGILGVVLNFVGAYLYGLQGVVAAGMIFSLAYFGWVFWLLRPIVPERMDLDQQ